MTYDEIQEKYPGEFSARRANKLYYRYPGIGGESYLGKFQSMWIADLSLTITSRYRRHSSNTVHDYRVGTHERILFDHYTSGRYAYFNGIPT